MQKIARPTLLVNEQIARQNIDRMVAKAANNGVKLRPHFKTHVSAEIGEWFREAGVTTCTVSSVEMAVYFQKAGWDDITIAFPFNRLEIPVLNELCSKGQINLVIEDRDTHDYLEEHLNYKASYYIKIDVGTHRTGLPVTTNFDPLVRSGEKLNFSGFLVHAGHSYRSRSKEQILKTYHEVQEHLSILKSRYPKAKISYGDTPTCSIVDHFEHIDELRAGNFVFYDWMQYEINSCTFDDIAVCMAVPVVAKHPARNEIVVHGGAVHFSKDQVKNELGETIFGTLVKLTSTGWTQLSENQYLKRVSQEHGILHVEDKVLYDDIRVGDILGVIPVHSCLTANLMGKYLTTTGKEIHHMNWRRV
ncbi:MAG: alanine racemase [Bacteroidota bacterium]